MNEYINKSDIKKAFLKGFTDRKKYPEFVNWISKEAERIVSNMPAADVHEKKYCKMIPLEPDCRGCTDVFICTNCHNHIHLGFIRQEYSGNFCLECGAELNDDDIK